MPPRLTGLVIARNEAHQLGACLASLAGVEALLVVDHGSTDGTAAVARGWGAQVIALQGDLGSLRAEGSRLAPTPWIIALDADERLPPDGVAMIQAALEKDNDVAAFRLPIHTRLGERRLRFGGYCPLRVRVYHRDRTHWPPARVHERPEIRGKIKSLPIPIDHHSYRDLAHAREKTRRYAAWGASTLQARGRQPTGLDAAFRAGWRWLRVGLLQGGLLMGPLGWRLTCLQAAGVWWRLRWARRGIPKDAADLPNAPAFAPQGRHLRE